jgi:hypothetical protein
VDRHDGHPVTRDGRRPDRLVQLDQRHPAAPAAAAAGWSERAVLAQLLGVLNKESCAEKRFSHGACTGFLSGSASCSTSPSMARAAGKGEMVGGGAHPPRAPTPRD